MDLSRRAGIAALLAAALVAGGCSGRPEARQAAPDRDISREEACMRLLRDLRLHCKEGIRDDRASVRMDCMSRRLQAQRQCL